MRTPTTAALLLALAASTTVTSPAWAEEDFGDPTAEQLEASVRTWNPGGSVRVWDPSGSVEPLETETTQGDETVVSLDSDILFAFGSTEVSPVATERLGLLGAEIPQGAAVSVIGHTDSVGDDAANLELSRQRAQAVAAAITAARPDLALDVQGRGETEPVAPNSSGGEDNPEGREQNRRVEIRYTT